MSNLTINKAWEILISEYNIEEEIKKNQYFEITAKQIKEYKEPRLMAKWDSSQLLPDILKKKRINILPNSRSSYILSDFKLYEELPGEMEHVTKMQHIELPEYETIDVDDITSESKAINVLLLSNILDDFLEEDNNALTFNGRMGTGNFDFVVDTYKKQKLKMSVNSAQCEIDAGLENQNSIAIIEAKNIKHTDFHIRQLYYPYRLWQTKVKKPIRLVFSIYSNKIFQLFEYEFQDMMDFSSIKLLKNKNYSLQDTKINQEEMFNVYKNVQVLYDDYRHDTDIPFVQADSFERVISLLEFLGEEPKTSHQISEFMQFVKRQVDYYFNAGRFLGLFEKENGIDEDGKNSIFHTLTPLGKKVLKMNYKERQLKLVELILQHKIFNQLFFSAYMSGKIPDSQIIQQIMKELNVVTDNLLERRSQSVKAWLAWIFNLTNV